MKPSAILHVLSLHFSARICRSASVAPWPEQSPFDAWFSGELDALQTLDESCTSSKWLMDALGVVAATQKATLHLLKGVSFSSEGHRKIIEDYLEDDVELLDVCNGLRDKVEVVKKYVESLRSVVPCIEGGVYLNAPMLARACKVLNTCEGMEKRCTDMEKCSSSLRKLGEKVLRVSTAKTGCSKGELFEVLSGSKSIALLVSGVLGISLSFKTKRGLPMISTNTTCQKLQRRMKEDVEKQRKSSNMVLDELRSTVAASKKLRDLINSQCCTNTTLNVNAEDLNRSCGQLEEWITPMEGRVNDIYKNLISIRMVLLGILSTL